MNNDQIIVLQIKSIINRMGQRLDYLGSGVVEHPNEMRELLNHFDYLLDDLTCIADASKLIEIDKDKVYGK